MHPACQIVMKVLSLFVNPIKGSLRSGWRVLIFFSVLLLPYLLFSGLSGGGESAPTNEAQFSFDLGMILTYVVLDGWLLLVSWLCLWLLERMGLIRLGFGFYPGWWRDLLLGCAMAAGMMIVIVVIQTLSGGTRLMLNPLLWKTVAGTRAIDWPGVLLLLTKTSWLLLIFIVAGTFEELLCRGYAFQTLLRDVPSVVPIMILSLIFGLMHVGNPNVTVFGIINTILAGVWLSVAYLKTRGLWFPTALHFMWNWTMGAFFGLPVSGLDTGSGASVFIAANESPVWLTGGNYGPEGGATTTLVLIIASVVIWRANWLRNAEAEQIPETPELILAGQEAE